VANTVYELPIGPGKRFWNHTGSFGKFLEGWSVSGLGLWHTGHPLTVLVGFDPSQLPDGNSRSDERPDLVPGVPLTLTGGGKNGVLLINPNAFQMPPLSPDPVLAAAGLLTRFGNAGRGLIRAPHSWQADVALMKETKLTERFKLRFELQAFNIFNHVQLGDPANFTLDPVQPDPANPTVWITQAGSNFGLINTTANFNNNNDNFGPGNTGTGLPRQIQLSLRFMF